MSDSGVGNGLGQGANDHGTGDDRVGHDGVGDAVARYEGGLRRRARARTSGAGDPALDELLRTIDVRRSRRSTAPVLQAVSSSVPGSAVADAGVRSAVGGRIISITAHGPWVKVFRIARPPGLDFQPGQYVELGVRGGRREDFSIASAPHDPHLDFAIELRVGGRVTPALFALGVGDTIDVGARAKGRLLLDGRAAHHLMVATVTGIAPLRSMVRAALHAGTAARFTILLGASHAVELPFHDELEALDRADPRVTYLGTVSRPGAAGDRAWSGSLGRVDALVPQVAGTLDPATTHVYAVGHAGMIESVRSTLTGRGWRISTESYGSSTREPRRE